VFKCLAFSDNKQAMIASSSTNWWSSLSVLSVLYLMSYLNTQEIKVRVQKVKINVHKG
jgi:hypothetical protein